MSGVEGNMSRVEGNQLTLVDASDTPSTSINRNRRTFS